MPVGELVTDPEPVPANVTVIVTSGTKFAVAERLELTVTVQVPIPAHPPPLQPVNTDPA
jgi:hypothetical protein